MSQLYYINMLVPRVEVIRANDMHQAHHMAKNLLRAHAERHPERHPPVLQAVTDKPWKPDK